MTSANAVARWCLLVGRPTRHTTTWCSSTRTTSGGMIAPGQHRYKSTAARCRILSWPSSLTVLEKRGTASSSSSTVQGSRFVTSSTRTDHIDLSNKKAPFSSSSSSAGQRTVRIGHVERVLADEGTEGGPTTTSHMIPTGYLDALVDRNDPTNLRHWQWMLQKDALGQDMLLVSSCGGVQRRRLALAYAELTERPVELLTISRDTTESDLQQKRRLIQQQQQQQQQPPTTGSDNNYNVANSTTTTTTTTATTTTSNVTTGILLQDQAPVRAAIAGHLLILDGLHFAERNVLPTLNNLLENRELVLTDGRMLVSPARYQYLLDQHEHHSTDAGVLLLRQRLVPVHKDFRVIGLLSSAAHQQLDPPVRSRFQIRRVDGPSTEQLLEQVQVLLPNSFSSSSSQSSLSLSSKKLTVLASALQEQTTTSSASTVSSSTRGTSSNNNANNKNSAAKNTSRPGGGVAIPFSITTALPSLARSSQLFPHESLVTLLQRVYPYASSEPRLAATISSWPAGTASKNIMELLCQDLLGDNGTTMSPAIPRDCCNYVIERVEPIYKESSSDNDNYLYPQAMVTFRAVSSERADRDEGASPSSIWSKVLPSSTMNDVKPSTTVTVTVPTGTSEATAFGTMNSSNSTIATADTTATLQVLAAMMQEHAVGRDILLIAPKGEGKSYTAKRFAEVAGYPQTSAGTEGLSDSNQPNDQQKVVLFPLYKDMTATDLLLRQSSSSTSWTESPLLQATRMGQICILDGIEKLSRDTLASLQGFLTDREVRLPDGTQYKLMSPQETHDDASVGIFPMMSTATPSPVRPIHPSFRVIALASIPPSGRTATASRSPATWLSEEVTSMFSTIALPAPSRDGLKSILRPHNTYTEKELDQLLDFHELLLDSSAECGVSSPLSIRTMLRLVKRGVSGEGSRRCLHESISSAVLANLIPPTQRTTLETLLHSAGIYPSTARNSDMPTMKQNKSMGSTREVLVVPDVVVEADRLTIGEFVMARNQASQPELVPSPRFFDIPSHVRMIRSLLSEWSIGEHAFLLLGNQGTGKNMICDRVCELANFEREYIQLHRDSTIGQLTLSPSLEDGKIVWKDSPLVRAVTNGRALVIDEADKAPLEVVAVLKSLVEDGELLLADGRRILRTHSDRTGSDIIQVHPDFTVWVLANRPGRLFHGNDFFNEIGDCFSAQVIPNPDLESEIRLLQSYAPSLDPHLLRRIAASFDELRGLFERGDITYPYSTREAIAVAKHLEKYPDDDIVAVLHNVLDLDSFNDHLYATLGEVFRGHGFKFQNYGNWQKAVAAAGRGSGALQIEYTGDRSKEGTSKPPPLSSPKLGKWDENNDPHVGGNQWQGGTGGSDTAGLGGRGGPYRLDRGHKVHQVSDEAKAEVSEEAKEAGRRIAEKALKDRLGEIGMSETEHERYSHFLRPIQGDIANLRTTLQSVEFKASERDWIKRQLDGELDDSKLVEGVAGERHVYKRRGIVEPSSNSSFVKKQKRLRFVVDCSASMYRFNGHDDRLNRCLQATTLVMESLAGMEDKYDYSIVGHSGDSRCIELVSFGSPPLNELERMRILHTMVAHTQFCRSGDNTLGAIRQAIADVSNLGQGGIDNDFENSSSIVIAISDANLERYGISPRELGRAMDLSGSSSSNTKAFCIFIASFGDEADEIKRALPIGKGFVCKDTSDLPVIVRNILTTEIG